MRIFPAQLKTQLRQTGREIPRRARSYLLKTLALFPPVLFPLFYWVAACLFLVYLHGNLFHFPYDWDPGDGDVLNVIHRLAKGQPVYAPWDEGRIMNLYPPLFHLLWVIPTWMGLEVLSLGRMLNLAMIIGASALCFAFVYRLLGPASGISERRSTRLMFATLAGLFQISVWQEYPAALNFRPDPLILVLVLGSTMLISLNPRRVWLAASLGALCALTKQNGLSVAAGTFLYYAMFQRELLKSFVLRSLAIVVPAVVTIEAVNHGDFIRSTLIDPARYLGESGRLVWDHMKNLWLGYFRGRIEWIGPLFALGVLGAIVKKSRPLALLGLVFSADLIYNLQAAQHLGAGGPYFWIHWHLVCVVAAYGAWYGAECLSFVMRKRARVRLFSVRHATLWVVVPLFLVVQKSSFKHYFDQKPRQLAEARAIGERHDGVIRQLNEIRPNARWVSERAPAAIVRSGKTLDHELCTINQAFSMKGDSPGAIAFRRDLIEGKYTYFQGGEPYSCGRVARLGEVLNSCFERITTSTQVFYGSGIPIPIYRYDGKRPECLALGGGTPRGI